MKLSHYALTSFVLACSSPHPRSPVAAAASEPAAAQSVAPPAAPGAAPSWPPRAALFVTRSEEGELVLRAWQGEELLPFRHLLAGGVGPVLVASELGLVLYSRDEQLWALDTRALDAGSTAVLIADGVPPHGLLQLTRSRSGASPERYGASDADLVFHWDEEPWLEADAEDGWERVGRVVSSEWLARERTRAPHAVPVIDFAPSRSSVALPESWQGCSGSDLCGASISFGGAGWLLVVAQEDEAGDFEHYRCVLHDPGTGLFSAPPAGAGASARWEALAELTPGSCGTYSFDAAGSSFLATDTVCSIGGRCESLGAAAEGWLAAGPRIGSP